ncbi:phage nozzle protein [Sphingopyxis flava]|uniref:Uncharacterized protein n=1 Tax=Sphingopyxis flava TaxID=1507287 RepID=A0A1T5BQX6_9SPHN|nr:hypothetical protein [Sphingopyxis flava]SKB49782.1 hypothetical protein SAMN06295937_100772 [Sphingopyxis flava]
MSLTTRTISSLLNGVSRQPAILRSQDQTEDEINTWGDIARGLGRRPPTKHIADLGVSDAEGSFIHHINRDTSERYVVIIKDGDLRVFDATDGAEKTVAFPFGKAYLAGVEGAFKAVTVADFTFIVNSSITPALGAVGDDEETPPAYYLPGGYRVWGEGMGI